MLPRSDEDASLFWLEFSGDELENSGFPSTVLTHQGNLRSFSHRERYFVEKPLWWCVSVGDLIESDDDVSFGHFSIIVYWYNSFLE